MSTPEATPRGSRETRLLLVTIAVSVGVLLLLARFRFPDERAGDTTQPSPAPLERLAARVAYDELASIMADLERRVAPRLTLVRMQSSDGHTSMGLAPRMLPDRAVAIVSPGYTIIGSGSGGDQEVIGVDAASSLAVIRVPAIEDSAVPIRQMPLRSGPRYVGLVEPSATGPVLRPVYVGRIDTFDDAGTGTTLLAFAGLQQDVSPGSAIFSLEGTFLGLVRDVGDTVIVVPGDKLRSAAEKALPSAIAMRGDLGLEVDALTAPLVRATGAEQGVVVAFVHPGGPADRVLRPGDVIQSVDGRPVTSTGSFRELERSRAPGANVSVTAIRARSPLEVGMTAGDVTAQAASTNGAGVVGRSVGGIGFEVVAVRESSPAARADLKRGDLVLAVDGETAPDAAALDRQFRLAPDGASVVVTIQRGEQHRVVAIEKR